MSLSSLIVQREIATIRQVEEALARQVLYGGDLATNLLEVAPIEEWRIAVTLADSVALPAAPPGALPVPSEDLLARLPGEIAIERGIFPLSYSVPSSPPRSEGATFDRARLVIAVAEPLTAVEIEHISTLLGTPIDIRIALSARVREALMHAYGAPLERRIERLLTKLERANAPPPPSSQPQPRSPSVPPFRLSPAYGSSSARSALAPQNRDETPGQPEVADAPVADAPVADAPVADAPPAPSERPSTDPPEAGRREHQTSKAPMRITQTGFPAPAPTLPLLIEAEALPIPLTVPAPQPIHTGEYADLLGAKAAAAEPKPTFVKATGNSVRPVRRHRGPLTAAQAEEELAEAVDRDALFDLFFEFARQFFDYAALFISHGDIAEGRDAFGDGAPRERVVGIGVPLDMPSMFQTAREGKEPFVLRPEAAGVDGVLLSDLRRPAGVEALIVPLLVRGRAVAILYADAASDLDRAAIAEIGAFAKAVGQGFERLIVRKKLAGFTAGAPASTVGKIDTTALPMPEKGTGPPTDKVARAEALGRALFAPSRASDRPGAYRPPEPAPVPPAPSAAAPAYPSIETTVVEPSAWSRTATPSETPLARGLIPAVLTPALEPMVTRPQASRPHPSSRPPPPQIAAIHRISDPPIPREDVEVTEPDAELESETLDDDAAQAILAEIGETTTPLAEDGEEVLVEVPRQEAATDEQAPYELPESEQAVAVGPRRPPTAHSEVKLPSIIVDITGELAALVERVLSGDQGQAEAELLRQGAAAMPAIMQRFPGPLAYSRNSIPDPLPKPSECGPLLRLIARQRKVALLYVLQEVASPDVSRRFWATYLLVELPYAEGARLLVPRLFDPDAKVRLVARAAGRVMADASHEALLGEIARVVREPSTSRTARLGLLEALGDLREAKAVAVLIGHLGDEDAEIATVARRALIAITRQDHALDTRKWLAWWGQNSNRHRVEWLIDALVDETQGIRRAAGEELKALTQETFGYYDDLPKRERERAQQRFRDWWASEGRARFVRS
jgi:HEAT repeat protein